jgi:Predicted nucleotidyltransferase
MRENIREELFRLEEEKDIFIVNARERGSRMLRVDHDNSDWDVMFLFAQLPENYVTIHGRIDSIHEPHVGENERIDLHGWNIDKFAGLARSSNPDAVEYCRGNPKEYIPYNGEMFEKVARNIRNNFNHMALYDHHMSKAKRTWEKYITSGKEPTKNRQFYVARSVAAAQYIRKYTEKELSLPPVDAYELSNASLLNVDLADTLRYLADCKVRGEVDEEIKDLVAIHYEMESDADMDPIDERINSPDDEVIDEFIREVVA